MRPRSSSRSAARRVRPRCTTRSQPLEVEENADRPGRDDARLPVNRTSAGDLSTSTTARSSRTRTTCRGHTAGPATPVHLRRLRALLAPASGPHVRLVDDRGLGAGRLVADEHQRQVAGVAGHDRRRGRERDLLPYGFTPADANTDDDSPQHHPDAAHAVPAGDRPAVPARPRAAQRQALPRRVRRKARRPYRVLHPAALDGAPAATITLVDPDAWNVDALDLDWDVMRPTEVDASQVSLDDSSGQQRRRRRDRQRPRRPRRQGHADLRRPDVDDPADRDRRRAGAAAAHGRGACASPSWFVRCRGEADVDRLGTVLRAGSVVADRGRGQPALRQLVRLARPPPDHADAAALEFTLVRNAIGPGAERLALAGGLGCHVRSTGRVDHRPRPTMRSRISSSTFAPASTASTAASSPTTTTRPPGRIKARCPRSSATRRPAGACRASRTRDRRSASRSCPRWAAACGSSSRAATSPIRSGSAATGATASCRPTSRPNVKVIVTTSPLKLKLDDDGGRSRSPTPNGNTVTLDSSGITLSNGGQQVVVGDSSVSVNDGALRGDVMSSSTRRDYACRSRIDGGSRQAARRRTPRTSSR